MSCNTNIMTEVPGLFVLENFLTEEEEAKLLKKINKCEWKDNRTKDRHVQIYGPWHDNSYKIIPGKFSEHPKWSRKYAKRIRKVAIDDNSDKLLDPEKCEIYTNKYNKPVDLQYHFDNRSTYDDCIYGISLNSDGFLGFREPNNKDNVRKIKLKRRSLYIMSGNARHKFQHGIEKEWITGERISITYRTIRDKT
jgi:alkylated DNA repair dioxygenase AlkB